MATKKQKRLAGEARAKKAEADYRAECLQKLEQERERRANQKLEERREQDRRKSKAKAKQAILSIAEIDRMGEGPFAMGEGCGA